MKEIELKVTNELGLHLRPAGQFVRMASEFDSEIWIEYQGNRINAKSIMGILSLAIDCGAQIKILADGPDEKEALEKLGKFVNSGFGSS